MTASDVQFAIATFAGPLPISLSKILCLEKEGKPNTIHISQNIFTAHLVTNTLNNSKSSCAFCNPGDLAVN